MPSQDPRVPPEVENYLIGIYAGAGRLGGELGGGAPRGGERGGARGARMLKTLVQERTGERSGAPDELKQRVADEFGQVQTLPSDDDLWRIVIPFGRTGLQRIVVDLRFTPVIGADPPLTTIRLLAFGKEGLLSRKPTAKTADRVWAALASAAS